MMNGISKKIKNFNELLDTHYHGTLSNEQKRKALMDFIQYRLFHNVNGIEYVQYDFIRYSKWARKQYITESRREIVHSAFNTKEGNRIFDNKVEFCKVFNSYLNRDWLDTTACSFDDFVAFVEKHSKAFGKPLDGWFGKGTGVHEFQADMDLKTIFYDLQKDGILLEELIEQHHEMAAFNAKSVNTLRIVTILRPDGSVNILSAGVRLGRKDRVADNFHHHGIAALIDIDTGIVYTQGIDKTSQRYVVHPDSKKQIVGFHIPMWGEIVEYVKQLATVVPEVHYVGWDIAIGEDCLYTVEGNCKADPDVIQMPDGIGKWPMIKPLIDEAIAEK